jgi:hypothetical protein
VRGGGRKLTKYELEILLKGFGRFIHANKGRNVVVSTGSLEWLVKHGCSERNIEIRSQLKLRCDCIKHGWLNERLGFSVARRSSST